ncbi:MAG TPA: DUF892 family protein [Solirubrobacteraceae bacterium]|jgi:ferritin-like metal-binding protein YciE|nr:DUF892 family protein [Solirubrobacteraceae bacterium]
MTDTDTELRKMVVGHLRQLHALQVGALDMFAGMLAAVRAERDGGKLPEVTDLLTNMLNAFGQHEEETKRHEREVRQRLTELGAKPNRVAEPAMRAGGRARVLMGRVGGQDYGANARDAFVFEHLEIAVCELLERAAARVGDERTAEMARAHKHDNEEMAAKIRRNWENVLSLRLACAGVSPARGRVPA